MLFSALAFSLAGLAAASPLAVTDVIPNNAPSKSQSKAFHLVVKRSSTPFDGMYINTFHVGAGIDLVGVGVGTKDRARIFYQNGTAEEYANRESSIISDGGQPAAPFGLSLVKDAASANATAPESIFTVYLTGKSTQGIFVSKDPMICPGSYLICDEPVSYYGGKHFNILKNQLDSADKVPEECTSITLVPECTQLNSLPEGSFSKHDFVLDTDCYVDAADAE